MTANFTVAIMSSVEIRLANSWSCRFNVKSHTMTIIRMQDSSSRLYQHSAPKKYTTMRAKLVVRPSSSLFTKPWATWLATRRRPTTTKPVMKGATELMSSERNDARAPQRLMMEKVRTPAGWRLALSE